MAELISHEDIYYAYFDCRKNKRNSDGALSFELNLEHNLYNLREEINNGTYTPGNYSCFIVTRPTPREVFAAEFRDRIVHHLVISKINEHLEKRFLYDIYACRIDKGTHFGINRLRHFMAASTANYTREAWCEKFDLKSFFASIDRKTLWTRLEAFLTTVYDGPDKALVLSLVEKIVLKDPTGNAVLKSPPEKWELLPKHKSLFNANDGRGLPIGNLTSQVFANFLLAPLDHFIKHDLGIKYYGRYVDDFYLIHEDREYLKICRKRIEEFVENTLQLRLNPKKVTLQRVCHGVKFLGVLVKPWRMTNVRRTEENFEKVIEKYNRIAEKRNLTKDEQNDFLSRVNSYLGIMSHYDTWRKRKAILEKTKKRIMADFVVVPDMSKLIRRDKATTYVTDRIMHYSD